MGWISQRDARKPGCGIDMLNIQSNGFVAMRVGKAAWRTEGD